MPVALEAHVIRAVARRAGLPQGAGGHFATGGSEANATAALCALTAAHPGFAARGAYFSFSGSFIAEQKHKKRVAFREVPADRLLVETDAPAMPLPDGMIRYPLPPAPGGEPVNHPANLGVAYEGLAELRGLALEELARIVEANFHRLFGKGSGGAS